MPHRGQPRHGSRGGYAFHGSSACAVRPMLPLWPPLAITNRVRPSLACVPCSEAYKWVKDRRPQIAITKDDAQRLQEAEMQVGAAAAAAAAAVILLDPMLLGVLLVRGRCSGHAAAAAAASSVQGGTLSMVLLANDLQRLRRSTGTCWDAHCPLGKLQLSPHGCLPCPCAAGVGAQCQWLPSACGAAICGGACGAAAAGAGPVRLASIRRRLRGVGRQRCTGRCRAQLQCSAGSQPQFRRADAPGAVCVWRRAAAATAASAPVLAARHDGVNHGLHLASATQHAYMLGCHTKPLYSSALPAHAAFTQQSSWIMLQDARKTRSASDSVAGFESAANQCKVSKLQGPDSSQQVCQGASEMRCKKMRSRAASSSGTCCQRTQPFPPGSPAAAAAATAGAACALPAVCSGSLSCEPSVAAELLPPLASGTGGPASCCMQMDVSASTAAKNWCSVASFRNVVAR